MNNQDLYIPGSKWLYLRIYTGPKTADVILADLLYPLSSDFINKKLADDWFFIRYADPDFHIRYRIKLKDKKHIIVVLNALNEKLNPLLDQRLVWKIEQGTYRPETEKYGKDSMEYAEQYFYADSHASMTFFNTHLQAHNANALWLFAIASADAILNDFKFKPEDKKDLLLSLNRSFGMEFGKDSYLAKQLSGKFRKYRNMITEMLDPEIRDVTGKKIAIILSERSKLAGESVKTMLDLYDKKSMEIEKNDLVSSLIHMSMNRIFRDNNRLHEMVLYDFLFRYYKSSLEFVVRNS